MKRLWALRGKRPVIAQRRRYQWLYAYIFVEPQSGESEYILLPSVSTEMMEIVLEEWSKAIDPQGKQIIVLLLDQARWHMSKKPRVPANIFLLPFPAYTPELSPAEPMVTKLKAPLANKLIETIQEVEDCIHEECLRLKKFTQEMKSLTLFPWIKHVLESI